MKLNNIEIKKIGISLYAFLSFTGLILSTIQHKERREFEFRLQEIDRWYKAL